MLTRKSTPTKRQPDWFLFSAGLMHSLCSDYIAVRLLVSWEPHTTALTIVPKILDVAEKAMKLHVAVQSETTTALADARSIYGHNLEKLRAACSEYHAVFNDPDIRAFTKDLNDQDGKLYQALRYGSQETTEGYSASIGKLLLVLDKIFCKSLLLLPEHYGRVLVLSSTLKHLLTNSKFDQTRSRDKVVLALQRHNAHYAELLDYCRRLDDDHAALAKRLETLRAEE